MEGEETERGESGRWGKREGAIAVTVRVPGKTHVMHIMYPTQPPPARTFVVLNFNGEAVGVTRQ